MKLVETNGKRDLVPSFSELDNGCTHSGSHCCTLQRQNSPQTHQMETKTMMAAALNPFLGHLDRLPPQLRNRIYALAVDSSDVEVDVVTPCRPYLALAAVSKQVRTESIGYIHDAYKQDCHHRCFTFKVPLLWSGDHTITEFSRASRRQFKRHNLTPNPVTYRFLTGHLGKDVPLAVMMKLKLPYGSVIRLYGASEKRTASNERPLNEDLRDLEYKLSHGTPLEKPRTWLETADVNHLIGCIWYAATHQPL